MTNQKTKNNTILSDGNFADLAGGNNSILMGGTYARLTGGNDSILTGGVHSILTGGNNCVIVGDYESTVKGKKGSLIVLIKRDINMHIVDYQIALIDGVKIKEDTLYTFGYEGPMEVKTEW
jgi:hypothetical protein